MYRGECTNYFGELFFGDFRALRARAYQINVRIFASDKLGHTMRKKITTVVFDLDGTLLDTLTDLAAAVNYALAEYGLPTRTQEEVRSFVGNGVRLLMERAVSEGAAHPHFDEIFATFKAYYVAHCREHTRPYDGIEAMLHVLRARGYRLAIVSNKLQKGVDELYETFFAETVQVAVGERSGICRKPSPDMVHLALDALAAKPDEAVYVGDSDVDVATARAAGLPCISVLWGFRDRDFLLASGAEVLAERPEEIPDLLDALSMERKSAPEAR